MRIDIISLFPGMFEPVLNESIMGRAQEKGLLDLVTHDLRDWSGNRHRKVDDKPFGGGPGMVMRVAPVVEAVEAVQSATEPIARLIIPGPQGRRLDQSLAHELSQEERLLFVCGHYEGMDERVYEYLSPEEVSIGDYILTGGELATMVIIDAIVRLLPGVLGSAESLEHESFEHGMLDYPHYTQPAEWRGLVAPEVLRSGHHGNVNAWRHEQALLRTRQRRPDLFQNGDTGTHGEMA